MLDKGIYKSSLVVTLKAGTINLKRVARKAHPNVYELIEQEHTHTEVSIAQLETGSQPPRNISKDNRIKELKKGLARTLNR